MKKIITPLLLIFSLISQAQDNVAIVIHGGAGNITPKNLSPELQKRYKASLKKAVSIGYKILETGGTSEEAVVATIKYLEDDTLFNAGRGAVFTNEGKNELDASIMSGKDKNAGAVAGVSRIKSPIEAAALVKNKSKHVMMAREGAEKYAQQNGLEMVDSNYFYIESRMKVLKRIKKREKEKASGNIDRSGMFEKHGTVGCVALDKYGNITAGTSTGGMTNKRFGRIGDSPIIGAGTYADNNTCGISCTGHGEYFIRNVVAYDVAALMEYGNKSIEEASKYVIHKKLVKLGGDGGLIGIDKNGNIVAQFNTSGMFRAWKKQNSSSIVKIF